MKVVNVISSQTLADIAIQETGDVEKMFDIAMLNNLSISDVLVPGMEMKVQSDDAVPENETQQFFSVNNLFPANGYTNDNDETFGGIGFMRILSTFIVS